VIDTFTGATRCRACNANNLFSALDLGHLPIANELMVSPTASDIFPLHLKVCSDCGLGQVADVVSPERLFRDYRYLSSVSQTFLTHAAKFVDKVLNSLDWKPGDWVLEIASNDGYLLRNFLPHSISVLGVEPASNVAEIARRNGVLTLSEFFCRELAEDILAKYGHPRLIIANNVYAHVPDIQDFTSALQTLMNERTLVSIENPSIMNLLEGLQFDSIYHEHYSYLSATSVSSIAARFNLHLIEVEQIPTHGGSNRYWLSKVKETRNGSVAHLISNEKSRGLFDHDKWQKFSEQVNTILNEFKHFCDEAKSKGEVVAGYGAAAKASTLINAAKIGSDAIKFIVDESPEKAGRYMPNYSIPIVGKEMLTTLNIDHVVIFPWNLADEIGKKIQDSCEQEVSIWSAIPALRRIF
jgi:C-methyltransferase C-terminal domain/Putative zinc binding domain/Methyltransferase domain